MNKDSTVKDLKMRVADFVNKPSDGTSLLIVVNYNRNTGKITSKYQQTQSCQDIDQSSSSEDTLVYEVRNNPALRKERPDDFKLIQFYFMKAVKTNGKSFYGDQYMKTLPRFEMFDINMTIIEVKRQIYQQIKHIFKPDSAINGEENEAELNRCLVLHVYDNLPFYNEGKYYTKKKG